MAVLFASAITLILCDKLALEEHRVVPHRRRRAFLQLFGEFVVLVLMAAAGVLQASLTSLAYFLVFLWAATWLGMHKPLTSGYRAVRTVLLLYSALHFMALYIYQLDYLQELVPPSSLQARLIGLSPLRVLPCNATGPTMPDTRVLMFRPLHWTLYVSPLTVFCFYVVVATVTRYQLLQQPAPESSAVSMAGGAPSHSGRLDSKRGSQRSTVSFARRHRRDSGVTAPVTLVRKAFKALCHIVVEHHRNGLQISLSQENRCTILKKEICRDVFAVWCIPEEGVGWSTTAISADSSRSYLLLQVHALSAT
uniref:Putative piezo-type mechanosensitive ion channel component 1 n=1 Tax=Ixodes scapularis TaxID=6945 RepID=A0A4D5RR89_IXOSC